MLECLVLPICYNVDLLGTAKFILADAVLKFFLPVPLGPEIILIGSPPATLYKQCQKHFIFGL